MPTSSDRTAIPSCPVHPAGWNTLTLTHCRCMHWLVDLEFPDILREKHLADYWHIHRRGKSPPFLGNLRKNPCWWLHTSSWTQSTLLQIALNMGGDGGGLWSTSSQCQYDISKASINLATKLSREYFYLSFVIPPLLSFCIVFTEFGNTFTHSKEKPGLLLTDH